MYDMPGVVFDGSGGGAGRADPPDGYAAAFEALLAGGKGMVFLHHAIAGWPGWDRYGEIIGGRFHYTPARWNGIELPDSGYRHDVTHTVDVLDPTHPIVDGVPASFEITDEVYLFPVDEANVTPLMRSRHRFTDDGFYSADLAVRGTRYSNEGWSHPPGSDLVAWTRQEGPSRIAYIQFGDGPRDLRRPDVSTGHPQRHPLGGRLPLRLTRTRVVRPRWSWRRRVSSRTSLRSRSRSAHRGRA